MSNETTQGQDAAATHLNSLLASSQLEQLDQGIKTAATLPVSQAAKAFAYMADNNQQPVASEMITAVFTSLGDSLDRKKLLAQETGLSDDEKQHLSGFFQAIKKRVSRFRGKHQQLETETAGSFASFLSVHPELAELTEGLPAELLKSSDVTVIHPIIDLLGRVFPLEPAARELTALAGNPGKAASEFSPSAVRAVDSCLDRGSPSEAQTVTAFFVKIADAFPKIKKDGAGFANELSQSLTNLLRKHPEVAANAEVLLAKIAQNSDDLIDLDQVLTAVRDVLPIPIASRVIVALVGNRSRAALESLDPACLNMAKNIERNLGPREQMVYTDEEKTEIAKMAKSLGEAVTKLKNPDADRQFQLLMNKLHSSSVS